MVDIQAMKYTAVVVFNDFLGDWVSDPCEKIVDWCVSLQGPLVRWLKVNFGEAFIAWIHVKALRVFVESVLR